MQNTSGIYPKGDRVLIRPDEVEEVSEGGIILIDAKKVQMAQSIGTLVACGPDCWTDHWITDETGKVKEVQGRREDYAKPGDRVIYAKYCGLQLTGADGEEYRLMNDEDITATCAEEVNFTDLRKRKPLSQAKE